MARKKRRAPVRFDSKRAVLFDVFTELDLERWSERSEDAQSYSDRVYFDLERQRAARYDELCDGLRRASPIEVNVQGWARVTDYRWCLAPLSPTGSLKGIGGRFNIGEDVDRARNQGFPALYIAADLDTAYREFFGGPPEVQKSGLQLQEFALRRKSSFTTFTLRGRVENVLDLHDAKGLRDFTTIISGFEISPDIRRFARAIGVRPRTLIRTTQELLLRLLSAPDKWRAEPQLFGIPAANQIFGRLVRDAGFDGILYPSQQGGTQCLAVFPQNIGTGSSRIEVVGGEPPGASHLVMDKNNPCI